MKHCFYYDESEHSRVINLSTVIGDTYYDSFLVAIVGWSNSKELEVKRRYSAFEEKYAYRKKKGELKSDTFKGNQFVYGFASFNKDNIQMLTEFFSIFSVDYYVYLCVASKMEFIIAQLFKDYHNSSCIDMDALRYSIIKAILSYRPEEVIRSIYKTPKEFVDSLIEFLTDRLECNKKNIKLKKRENEAFKNILLVLQNIEPPASLAWDYHMPFVGFNYFLRSKGINEYYLIIDKEGEAGIASKTLIAATEVGLKNCSELDSKDHFGIRIADMLVGVVAKLMKSLCQSLRPSGSNVNITKTLLDKKWFQLSESQLRLYKMLHHIILEINIDWYKVYGGNYSDDLISLLGLLEFMNHFDNVKDIEKELDMQPEYCNSYMCQRLEKHFQQIHNKLPVEPIYPETSEYFRNKRGAKVYFDISKQPVLRLKEGQNRFEVVSVGISKEGQPLVTIEEENENICYRLPEQLRGWALTVVGMANMSESLFPSEVVFTKRKNDCYADIL